MISVVVPVDIKLLVLFLFIEIGFHTVAQAELLLVTILLPQSLKCGDYKIMLPHQADINLKHVDLSIGHYFFISLCVFSAHAHTYSNVCRSM